MKRLAGPRRRRWPLANSRRLLFEPYEDRRLLASDWQNPDQRLDANDDLFVSPVDVLGGINRLNSAGPGPLPDLPAGTRPAWYFDVNGDRSLTPVDLLVIINALNLRRPIITVELSNDTAAGGARNSDHVTSDPAVIGGITSFGSINTFRLRIDGGDAVDMLAEVSGGRFRFDRTRIEQVLGGPLTDGPHLLDVQMTGGGSATTTEARLSFTLDTTAPASQPPWLEPIRETFSAFELPFVDAYGMGPAAFDANSYLVTIQGGDRDGETVPTQAVFRRDANTVFVQLAETLADGGYRLSIASDVTDIAGNVLNGGDIHFQVADPTGVLELSPVPGEEMVSVTRSAVVHLDERIDPASVTEDTFYLTALGQRLPGRVVVSSTERFATFFHDEPLPAATAIRVVVDGDQILGRDGLPVDADGDNQPGGRATAEFRTLPLTRIPGTHVFGYVYDAYHLGPDGGNLPVVGATIRVDAFPEANAVTDENGYFELRDMPAPEFYVHVDGGTAVEPAPGVVYPSVGKPFHSVPGQRTQLGMDGQTFDVFLPPMATSDVQELTAGSDTQVHFGEAARAELAALLPNVDPSIFSLAQVTFPADSARYDDGTPATQGAIIPVPPERIPAPLPPGQQPPLVISIQAGGATRFDAPASVEFPNLEGLPAGETSLIFSFDHAAGRWDVVGTGTVSVDGRSIVSDGGVIRAPGWHFTQPGSPPQTPPSGKCDGFNADDGWAIVQSLWEALNAIVNIAPIIQSAFDVVDTIVELRDEFVILKHSLEDGQIDQQEFSAAFATLTQLKDTASNVWQNFTGQDPLTRFGKAIEAATSVARTAIDRVGERGEKCLGAAGKAIADVASQVLQSAERLLENAVDLSRSIQEVPLTVVCLVWDEINDLVQASGAAGRSTRGPESNDGELLALLGSLISEADIFVGGQLGPLNRFEQTRGELELSTRQTQQGYSQLVLGSGGYQDAFWRITIGSLELQGRSNASGLFNLPAALAANTLFRFEVFDLWHQALTTVDGTTGASGQPTLLQPADTQFFTTDSPDRDGDGLADLAERVIGTNPDLADSDADGLTDLAELEQGLDALDDRGFPTGVIASLAVSGQAQAVVVERSTAPTARELAYVATGTNGLAIVDVSQFNLPIVLGQLALPGNAVDVSVHSQRGLVVVASQAGGAHFVDVSDPLAPRLVHTIVGTANQVEVADNIVYVASFNAIRSFDLVTREPLQTLALGAGSITGMAREGTLLYTMDADRVLRALDVSEFQFRRRGSVVMPQGGGQLFVGGGIAYVAATSFERGGFATADVSDPDQIRLISGSDVSSPLVAPATAIVANGSGLGLLIGVAGGNLVDVMDVSEPTDTNVFLTRFSDLNQQPQGVSIAAGIGFIAAGSSGLVVLNYRAFDNQGRAPSVRVNASATDLDPIAPGVQVNAGQTVPLQLTAMDDIQVRNVDLLVDGQTVASDVSFPFEFSVVAPTLAPGGDPDSNTMIVEVRAWDTGGNSMRSAPLIVQSVADTFGPTMISADPDNGSTRSTATRAVRIGFSEPLAASTVTSETFQLLAGDGAPIPASEISLRADDRLVQLSFDSLPAGSYQLRIDASAVTDRAGNPLGSSSIVTDFSLVDATIFWTNPAGGDWNEPSNWDLGRIPNATDFVAIDVPGEATITHSGGATTVASLSCNESFILAGGSLTLLNASNVTGRFTLAGGSITGDADLTLSGPVRWEQGSMTGTGRTLTTGSVDIVGAGFTSHAVNGRQWINQGTVNWTGGHFFATPALRNEGTLRIALSSAHSSQDLRGGIDNAGTLVLAGSLAGDFGAVINILAGGTFDIAGDFSLIHGGFGNGPEVHNAGTLLKSQGEGTAALASTTFDNTGTVQVQAGTLSFGAAADSSGQFQIDPLATVAFTGGISTVDLSRFLGGGLVDLAGGNVTLTGETSSQVVQLRAGTLNVANDFTLTNMFTFAGGSITGDANLTLSGPVRWEQGSMTGTGRTLTTGTLDIVGAGFTSHGVNGRQWINQGTVNWTGGHFFATPALRNEGTLRIALSAAHSSQDLRGGIDNAGTLVLAGSLAGDFGAVINNLAGGTFDIAGDFSLIHGGFGNGPEVHNAGTLLKSQGEGTAALASTFDNTGTVQVRAGTLRIAGSVAQHSGNSLDGGVWEIGPGSTLDIATGASITTNLAVVTLSGPGSTFTKFNSLAVNSGRLQVLGGRNFATIGPLTNSGDVTIGAGSSLTVGGNSPYTQTGDGAIHVEIGGLSAVTDYGRLNVTGSASLDGTLEVQLVSGFLPEVNDQFQVLTFDTRNGDFAAATGLTLPNGLVLDRSFEGSGMWLTAASPLLAAAPCDCPAAQGLTADQAQTLWDAAQSWLAASGLPIGGLARLSEIQVRVADLPSGYLGAAYGSVVVLEVDAAGFGWFIDATPDLDEEFTGGGGLLGRGKGAIQDAAQGRMDLLTVVLHEMGHVLGLEHGQDAEGVLFESLSAGRRRRFSTEELDAIFSLWQP